MRLGESVAVASARSATYGFHVAARTTLLDEALDLPADERAELAVKLIDSLTEHDDRNVADAWETEIRRRVLRTLDGDAKTFSWSDVRTRILARLPRR